MSALQTDEDGKPLEPPPGHVQVRARPSRAAAGGPRVYLCHRTLAGDLRAIPFTPAAARALAAELILHADEGDAPGPADIAVAP